MSLWCLQFPPKNERKQVDLRYHSSKVEFVCSLFGGIEDTIICFRDYLTLSVDGKSQKKIPTNSYATSNWLWSHCEQQNTLDGMGKMY